MRKRGLKMIGNYIKRDPDPVQAVLFTGFNFEEVNKFLKAKAVYGYFVKTRTLKQIRFFDNFTLRVINVGNYLIFDPKVRSFEVMPEYEFEKKYSYKNTIVEKKDA